MWDEGVTLAHAAQLEVGAFPPEAFDPQKAPFLEMESRGLLRVYTMRLDGRLIGFCMLACAASPWYPSILVPTTFVNYVVPEHRGRLSVRFIRWVDEALRDDGAYGVGRQVRPECDYSRTLSRLGYAESERSYFRRF